MNYEQMICDSILDYISKRKNEQLSRISVIQEQSRLEQIYLLECIDRLEAFEKKHLKQLQSIYLLKEKDSAFYHQGKYLFSAYNEIGCLLHNEEESVKHQIQQEGLSLTGGVHITYQDFEKEIGLSSKSIKKYLEILEVKQKIKRERFIGGYLYYLVSKEEVA